MGIQTSLFAANPPRTIFYQGRLTSDTGVPLNGTFTLDFALCATSDCTDGSDPLWTESHTGVSVDRGVYSIYLGSNTAGGLPESLFDQKLWLEVSIDGNLFTPRTELSAMPYSHNTYQLSGIKAGNQSGSIPINNGTINQNLNADRIDGEDLSDLNGRYVDQAGDTMGGSLNMTADDILLNGGWLSGDGDNALTITTLGAVGINTGSPVGNVHILGRNVEPALDTAPLVLEERGDNDQMFLGGDEIDAPSSDGGIYLQNNNPADVYMVTGGGSVGIDTNSPLGPLDIGNQGYIAFHNDGGNYFLGGGNTPDARTTGLHLETGTNPANGEALFVVESSGGAERFAVEHNGALRGDNNLQINGFPSGPSYITNETDGFGIGTSSPASTLEVAGDITVEGTTSTPTSSNTVMGFQQIFASGSSGSVFRHPDADVGIDWNGNTIEVENDSGDWWNFSIMVVDGGSVSADQTVCNGSGCGVSIALDTSGAHGVWINAKSLNSASPGFTFQGTAWDGKNQLGGMARYWR
jgi:hypothetical protein